MKINTFQVRNFGGISTLDDSPEKVNVLLYPNGSGKSSYLKALKFALTGDTSGEGFIKNGTDSACVKIDTNGHTICRKKSASASKVWVDSVVTTQKSVTELFENFGCHTPALKLVTSSEVLGDLKSGTLTKYFLESGILPIAIDANKLISLCNLTPKACEELRHYLPLPPETINLDGIKEAYDWYYETRKSTKAALKEYEAKAKLPKEIAAPTMTLEEIDTELAKLNDNNQTLLLQQYNEAIKRKEVWKNKLIKIDEEISAIVAEKPDEKVLQELNNKKDKLLAAKSEKEQLIAVLTANIEQLENTISNLDKKICPIHSEIVCVVDKTPYKAKLAKVLADTVSEKAKAESDLKSIPLGLDAVYSKISEYNENEKKYIRKSELLKRKDELVKEEPIIPSKPSENDSGKLARVEELKRLRRDLIMYNEALANGAKAKEAKNRYDIYNELVENLSQKSGLSEAVLNVALEPLLTVCNDTAKKLKLDFAIKTTCVGGLKFFCQTSKESGFVPFDAISNGEKIIAELLIMDMLNSLSGIHILILDNLDTLDSKTFKNLLSLVYSPEFSERYDHIYLAGVNHPDAEEVVKKYNAHKVQLS